MNAPEKSEEPRFEQGSPTPKRPLVSNRTVAKSLMQYADILEQQGAAFFRVQAYRNASKTLLELPEPIDELLERDGRKGLTAIPTIGVSIASAIAEMVMTGHWTQLDRVAGNLHPQKLFMTIPGVGHELADRFCEELHLETLEDLEKALMNSEVHVKGLGPRRREGILAVLATRLGHAPATFHGLVKQPPEEMVLEIDELYRKAAAAGSLPMITPKRNNPKHQAWLPILHVHRDEWHFTIMYSNTTAAFRAGKNKDWVVVIYQADGHPEGRCTVVTETRGAFKGLRVVRGLVNEPAITTNLCR